MSAPRPAPPPRSPADDAGTDAAATQERLLDAATEEFAAHGFAGARIDRIARRAGRNKQLLYHHFGNKEALHAAVAIRALATRPPIGVDSPDDLGRFLQELFDDFPTREAWWRLMLWESLETRGGPVVAEEERRAASEQTVRDVERVQASGLLDPALPPRLLLLAVTGMIMLPFLMPQLVRLWCGTTPADPEFRARYRAVVAELLSRFAARRNG